MIVYFACFAVGFTAKMLLDDHRALLRELKERVKP